MSDALEPTEDLPVDLSLDDLPAWLRPPDLVVNHARPATWYLSLGDHGRQVLMIRTAEGCLSMALDESSAEQLAAKLRSNTLVLRARQASA